MVKITYSMEEMETLKKNTLTSVTNIALIAEQSAAATEEVGATVTDQLEAIRKLSEVSVDLVNNAKQLEQKIGVFQYE